MKHRFINNRRVYEFFNFKFKARHFNCNLLQSSYFESSGSLAVASNIVVKYSRFYHFCECISIRP